MLSVILARHPSRTLLRLMLAPILTLLILGLSTTLTRPVSAAPSGITYLGQLLVGGVAANGSYDFQFQLFNAATGGTQVGPTVTVTSVPVAQGLYFASIYFGGNVFTGQTLWLQISYRVHPSSGNPAYTTQSPRQVAPNSAFADYAQLSGSTAALQSYPISTTAPTNGQVLQWNGSLWTPTTPSGGGGGSYTAGTGLTLSGSQFSVTTGGITSSLLANSSVTGSKLALPLTASVSSSSDLFTLSNTGSGRAIVGNSSSNTAVKGVGLNGVYGQGTNYGVQASGSNYGVYATSGKTGVYGKNTSSGNGDYGFLGGTEPLSGNQFPVGVYGNDTAGGVGVYGDGNTGVRGNATNTNGSGVEGDGTYGVSGYGTNYGVQATGTNYGVYAVSSKIGAYASNVSNGNGDYGLLGGTESLSGNNNPVGVFGYDTSSTGYGVIGYSAGDIGVYGQADNSGSIAVAGVNTNSGGYAAYFTGNVHVNGTLSKSGGSFKIDDPIDPAHKFLSHSFVESPDMMNIYNGNVTTDANGDAAVTLPKWFQALNQDYRYQLTVIGQFAQAIIATKVHGNQFAIKTDKPNVEVSWQVTGIRHDAWANAHRIPVEEDKPDDEQGLYLNPKEFGVSESLSIMAQHPGAAAKLGQSKPPTVGGQQ